MYYIGITNLVRVLQTPQCSSSNYLYAVVYNGYVHHDLWVGGSIPSPGLFQYSSVGRATGC